MSHHDEGFIATAAEGFDNVLDKSAVVVVKTMKRLVENKQLWVFYECPCHENQALLTA